MHKERMVLIGLLGLLWPAITLAADEPKAGARPAAELPGSASKSKREQVEEAKAAAMAAALLEKAYAGSQPTEAARMLIAILRGSQMGMGEGWFGPSQSRYGLKWLAARYDADHDGVVSRDEFKGPASLFDRLDRSRDGVLSAVDFDWSDRSFLNVNASIAGFWFRRADTNSNGRISVEEWQALFSRAAKGKSYLTADDLREAFPLSPPSPPPGKSPPRNEGPTGATLLRGLFSGELGSLCEGPGLGQRAPDFTLKTQDGKQEISLAQFRGKKPVVLVFGSFT